MGLEKAAGGKEMREKRVPRGMLQCCQVVWIDEPHSPRRSPGFPRGWLVASLSGT